MRIVDIHVCSFSSNLNSLAMEMWTCLIYLYINGLKFREIHLISWETMCTASGNRYIIIEVMLKIVVIPNLICNSLIESEPILQFWMFLCNSCSCLSQMCQHRPLEVQTKDLLHVCQLWSLLFCLKD